MENILDHVYTATKYSRLSLTNRLSDIPDISLWKKKKPFSQKKKIIYWNEKQPKIRIKQFEKNNNNNSNNNLYPIKEVQQWHQNI